MKKSIINFYCAPFAPDGEKVDYGELKGEELSPQWVNVCSELLASQGRSFRVQLQGELSHIEIKMIGNSGVALVWFYAKDQLVSSNLLCSGRSAVAEEEIMAMFQQSLKEIEAVKAASKLLDPFAAMLKLDQRPLWVPVIWPNPSVSEMDSELIRELSTHFAAAFFMGVRD